VEIIDGDDQRAPIREPSKQFSERGHPTPTELARILGGGLVPREVLERFHAAEHGKQKSQRARIPREDRVDLSAGEAAEESSQLIDDRVQGLVRDGLALIAAAGEDHCVVSLPPDAPDELLEQGAFSDAGGAVEAHQHGSAVA
jgi:hypothetical protein